MALAKVVVASALTTVAQSLRRRAKDYQYQNDQILCPVLAQLHRIGALGADDDGNTEISQMFAGLHFGAGIEEQLSLFQAFGITGFPPEQKNIEEVRDRCAPFNDRGNQCFNDRVNLNITDNPANFRFINLFKMSGKQVLEHGISTGVRGGGINMPPGALDVCKGTFPCEALFQKFFLNNANPDGNFYEEDLMKIVCLARAEGDRGGEHSYRSGTMFPALPFSQVEVDSEEWQMKGALTAMLQAYGRRDGKNVLYMTSDDMRQMMMMGKSPKGWQKRPNGCIEPQPGCEKAATERWTTQVGQCSTPLHGEFWTSQSSCRTVSGQACATDSDCQSGKGLMCYSGRCTCKRGASGTQTCWSRRRAFSPTCREDQTRSSCSIWGQPCRVYKATNPEAPGN